jgi:hypothetical protein
MLPYIDSDEQVVLEEKIEECLKIHYREIIRHVLSTPSVLMIPFHTTEQEIEDLVVKQMKNDKWNIINDCMSMGLSIPQANEHYETYFHEYAQQFRKILYALNDEIVFKSLAANVNKEYERLDSLNNVATTLTFDGNL